MFSQNSLNEGSGNVLLIQITHLHISSVFRPSTTFNSCVRLGAVMIGITRHNPKIEIKTVHQVRQGTNGTAGLVSG